MTAEPAGQVSYLTGFDVDLMNVSIRLLDEGDALAIRRPVRAGAVIAQLLVERRRIVENVLALIRRVIPLENRHNNPLNTHCISCERASPKRSHALPRSNRAVT